MECQIELQEITADQNSVLRNLMEKYLHDFSEFDGEDVDEHGLFGYRYIDFYEEGDPCQRFETA